MHGAPVEQDGPIGVPFHDGHGVGGQENRRALGPEFVQARVAFALKRFVPHGKGFVDDVTPVMLNVPDEQEECRFAAMEDGQTGYLKAAMHGSATILWREGGTGVQWAVVRIGKSPILLPVKLEQYGGEQGDDENPATWTYNVIDLCTGEVIEDAVDPTADPHKWQRPTVGWMIEATFGYAHYNGDGDLVLGWINEMVDQEPCEDSESSGSEY